MNKAHLQVFLYVLGFITMIPGLGDDLKSRLSEKGVEQAFSHGQIYVKKQITPVASGTAKLADNLTEDVAGISNINKGRLSQGHMVKRLQLLYGENPSADGVLSPDAVDYTATPTASFLNADYIIKQGGRTFTIQGRAIAPGDAANPNERFFVLDLPLGFNDAQQFSIDIEFGPGAAPKANTNQYVCFTADGPASA